MDEREFELINILGADLGSNQREISRHMNLSLGMINMLIRRLIAKGYIRIEQLNKRKVQYILTPKGFSEKMRKSVKYTMKTISSIGLIKNRVKGILLDLYKGGTRDFHFFGNPDICLLVEMIFREVFTEGCTFHILKEIPREEITGTLLICKERVDEADFRHHKNVNLIEEIAKEHQYSAEFGKVASAENS